MHDLITFSYLLLKYTIDVQKYKRQKSLLRSFCGLV